MSGDKTTAEAPEAPSLRQAAIDLLAELNRESITSEPYLARLNATIDSLRLALASERTRLIPIERPELVEEGIAIVRASAEGLRPEHIIAIVEAAAVSLEHSQAFAMRWDADMRAIKRWQAGDLFSTRTRDLLERCLGELQAYHGPAAVAAELEARLKVAEPGQRDLIWPDHADLVVWLLDMLDLRPDCPSFDESMRMATMIGRAGLWHASQGSAHGTSIEGPQLAALIIGLCKALQAASRRALMAESTVRFATGGFVSSPAPQLNGRRSRGDAACKVCGCTRITACDVPTERGSRACGWAGPDLCDNPICIEAERVRLEANVNRYLANAATDAGVDHARDDIPGMVAELAPGWTYQVMTPAGGVLPKITLTRYAPSEPL